MIDFVKNMASMALPFWMNKGEPATLLKSARRFWGQAYGWITWPLQQFDPLVCTEPLLNLLAYDRDINRFNGEPLAMFRKRVAYAFVNAADAGSAEGLIAIFERMGIGYVELLERQPDIDWDVLTVKVTDSQIAGNPDLLLQIIRQYGRTCRRYRFEVITPQGFAIRAGWYQGEYICYAAALPLSETASTFSAKI